jgi:hypothetical protein
MTQGFLQDIYFYGSCQQLFLIIEKMSIPQLSLAKFLKLSETIQKGTHASWMRSGVNMKKMLNI